MGVLSLEKERWRWEGGGGRGKRGGGPPGGFQHVAVLASSHSQSVEAAGRTD